MAYLGNDLQVAFPVYRNIDDISGSFNSSLKTFPLTVSGVAPVPAPLYSQQCLISVGGVVQRPDDTGSEGFRLSGGNIIFASAPTTGADFFGVILAGADYINAGGNFPSGTAAVPSITFNDDLDTGIYNSGINQVSITTGGSERLRIDSAGQIESVSLGTAAAPAFSFTTDPNTGIYSLGADQVAISTGGSGRLFVDASGNIKVGTGPGQIGLLDVRGNVVSFTNFRSYVSSVDAANTRGFRQSIDGAELLAFYHTNTAAVFEVNVSERLRITSAGLVGVGTSSPSTTLHVAGTGLIRTSAGANPAPLATETSAFSVLENTGYGSSPSTSINIGASNRDAVDFNSAFQWSITTPSASASAGARLTFSSRSFDGTSTYTTTPRMTILGSGNVGIGATSPSHALDVVGNINAIDTNGTRIGFKVGDTFTASTTAAHYGLTFGAAGANTVGLSGYDGLAFYNRGQERFRCDSSGRLLVGTSTTVTNGQGDARLQVTSNSSNYYAADFGHFSNDIYAGVVYFKKTRSTTAGGFASVVVGDCLADIRFAGTDGTGYVRAGSIECFVDGTPGANDMPGRIVLSTTLDGASAPTERLRITNDGVNCYNQAAPVSYAAAATLVIGDLKNGLVQYTGSAATLTLPTGTLTEGGFSGLYTNMTFEWSVINTGSGTCTIGNGTDHTVTGSATVAAGASGRFASRRTAFNTFVSYRLS